MKYDVFISHSNKDKKFVLKLAKDLIENGVKVWLDEWNLGLGDSIAESINKAIEESRFIFLIMSPDYFASAWTTQEWNMAMHSEMAENSIRTIPIYYRNCEIPPILQSKQWADFRNPENYTENFKDLIRQVFLLKKENRVSKYKIQNENETVVGSTIEKFDTKKLDEITKTLKEAVEAFKSEPSAKLNPVPIDEKLCFIVMPFGNEQLNIVYEDFVKPPLENICNLKCERGDDVFGSNVIMDDITKSIEKARIIVADLTGRNPNVFYEVGIAHTLNKNVLLLAQNIDDVPFDLRHRRVLLYEYSPRGCKKLENEISKHINSLLVKPSR
jgi:hypothetical protein